MFSRYPIQAMWAVLSLLAIVPACPLQAQAVSGSIIGTVMDSTNAVVPGAKITITDVNKGTTFTVQTNESGNFTQTQLTPGTYKVSVQQDGFKLFTQQNVDVTVGVSTRLDVTLSIGASSQEVTVSESVGGLQT